MSRLVRLSMFSACAALVLPLFVGSVPAIGGTPLAQLSPNSTPKADTDQILGVVQGVAADAGTSYLHAKASAAAGASSVPVGGVQAGFGGGTRAETAGLSPVVVSVAIVATLFAGAAVSYEVRRRRRAAVR